MVEEAISCRELAVRAPARRGRAAGKQAELGVSQAELEVSHWLVTLVALGSGGVLIGFWGLAAWGLYTLFI